MNTTIKKYKNRKMYNTETSKYVTLTEILAMPAGSFTVVDNETKEVVTGEVLLSAMNSFFSNNPEAFLTERNDLFEKVRNLMVNK